MHNDNWTFTAPDGTDWEAKIEADREPDNVKLWHWVREVPSGQLCFGVPSDDWHAVDLSPYESSRAMVELAVACGNPDRDECGAAGSVSARDLIAFAVSRIAAAAFRTGADRTYVDRAADLGVLAAATMAEEAA